MRHLNLHGCEHTFADFPFIGAAAYAYFSCLKKGHYYFMSSKEDFSALKYGAL